MASAGEKSRVGILGGTFDPVHLGHLRAAEEVREILGLSKVYFVPSAVPPHKDPKETTPAQDRLAMLELAVGPIPYFEVSTYELEKGTTSYTIDTLGHLSSSFACAELYFIVGSELFQEIDTWKNYKDLFKLANFAVMERPGFTDAAPPALPLALEKDFRYYKSVDKVTIYKNSYSKEIVFTQIQGVRVSSTEIRSAVKAGKPVKGMVPEEVERYILTKGLYTQEAVL
jgi:nicotinate-nucleotide adenylyltransferase